MFCIHCGKEIIGQSNFCHHCGTKVSLTTISNEIKLANNTTITNTPIHSEANQLHKAKTTDIKKRIKKIIIIFSVSILCATIGGTISANIGKANLRSPSFAFIVESVEDYKGHKLDEYERAVLLEMVKNPANVAALSKMMREKVGQDFIKAILIWGIVGALGSLLAMRWIERLK